MFFGGIFEIRKSLCKFTVDSFFRFHVNPGGKEAAERKIRQKLEHIIYEIPRNDHTAIRQNLQAT